MFWFQEECQGHLSVKLYISKMKLQKRLVGSKIKLSIIWIIFLHIVCYYQSASSKTSYFGQGFFKHIFGHFSKPVKNHFHGYQDQWTSPKPDFEKDKLPDYELYLLGR